ncbi:hypothetical protein C922_04673 [Plasmodium inui San Antonio 1]|uniref:PDZ GRASP-type domain-containing protein n=1 Tax=Plasmodium inui San Antonio 1 TaxID=1237626 RepID=W7AI28_9APIC|nr:hypothetical protein C922_04673 [Plasmodium inui San Antonio 1]EUD64941.1 hypothetical protein C922_04673 [Plasmodium inui San Antonio 1]
MGAGHAKEGSGGYRIVRICPEGPVSECDMEIFFDYIVQIEDVQLQDASRKTYESFMQKVREGENKEVRLIVYSCRHDKLKEVHVRPRRWSGKGLLGMNISYEKANAMEEGIQIVSIEDGHSDVRSKVTEKEDIIIGHEENILRNCDELRNFVEANLFSYHRERKKRSPLELPFYVYNRKSGDVRKVKMQVDLAWGNHGLIGCHLRSGGHLCEMDDSIGEGWRAEEDTTRGGSHVMGRDMRRHMNRQMNREINRQINRELTQEAVPYDRPPPPEHVTTAEWTNDLSGKSIEWGADPSVRSSHIRFGRNETKREEAEGEEPVRPDYGRLNTHFFRDGSVAGALGTSMSSSLGRTMDRSLDNSAGGEKSYALSSTIEVAVEGCAEGNLHMGEEWNLDMSPDGALSDISSGGKKPKGKHVMQPAQIKHTLNTSPTSHEWNLPPEQEQPPPDQRDSPADRYERYVRNMKTYSEEMLEVYKDMDENGRLLEELKLRTLRNSSMGEKLVSGECDYLAGEVSAPVVGFPGWTLPEGDKNERSGIGQVDMEAESHGGDGLLM